ncbi:hypothetical protein HERIO_656 [Hepatospora eriocheir]|nr:hypothetical protein HERIO_656 [Hepatospora eriocheir]
MRQSIIRQTSGFPTGGNIFIKPFYHLGCLYRVDHPDIIKDHIYALKVFEQGSQLNCKDSSYAAAQYYEDGIYVKKDSVKSFCLFKRAASLGHPDAMVKISLILLRAAFFMGDRSQYRKKHVEIGFKMLEKSAIQGCLPGIIYTAKCLSLGIGTNQDLLQALWWYRIAAKLGDIDSDRMARKLKKAIKKQTKLDRYLLKFDL